MACICISRCTGEAFKYCVFMYLATEATAVDKAEERCCRLEAVSFADEECAGGAVFGTCILIFGG